MVLEAVSDGNEGDVKLAKLLVENRADVNVVTVFTHSNERKDDGTMWTPLMWAAKPMRDNRADDAKDPVCVLSSNGAKVADREKDEWQGVIDGVMSVSAATNRA